MKLPPFPNFIFINLVEGTLQSFQGRKIMKLPPFPNVIFIYVQEGTLQSYYRDETPSFPTVLL